MPTVDSNRVQHTVADNLGAATGSGASDPSPARLHTSTSDLYIPPAGKRYRRNSARASGSQAVSPAFSRDHSMKSVVAAHTLTGHAPRPWVPVAALLLAFTIFSAYTVFMKKAITDGSNPIVLAFLRELLATSILLPAAYASQRRKPVAADRKFWPERGDAGTFVLLGACMIWGAQLMSALALQHITPGNYALLAPTVPVITLAVALLAGYEPFHRRNPMSWLKVVSIAVTVAGALYIAITALLTSAASPASSLDASGRYRSAFLGNVLLLLNKLCVSLYPILEKHLLARYDPLVIVAWGYAAGAALTLMSVLPCAMAPDAWVITPSGVGAILYAGILSSAFNYSLMCWVNKHTSPVLVMSFYPYQTICTPLLAWVFLGSSLGSSELGGGLVIVAGLAACVFARWREGMGTGPALTPLTLANTRRRQHHKLQDEEEDDEDESEGDGDAGTRSALTGVNEVEDAPLGGSSLHMPSAAGGYPDEAVTVQLHGRPLGGNRNTGGEETTSARHTAAAPAQRPIAVDTSTALLRGDVPVRQADGEHRTADHVSPAARMLAIPSP